MTITAALVIAQARETWINSPETDGATADSFDHHISVVGLQPYGELYQEVYAVANEGHEVVVGGGQAQLDQRKERAARLWQQLLPELEAYVADCQAASYTGWSSQSDGPVRRA